MTSRVADYEGAVYAVKGSGGNSIDKVYAISLSAR